MTTTLADTKTTILFPGDNSRSRSRNASAVEERRYRGYDGAFTSREFFFFLNTANVIYWQLVKYCSISLVFLFSLWAIPWKYEKEDDAEVYKGSEWVKLCLTRWTDQAYRYMVMRGIVDTLDTGFWLWSCQSREKGEEQSFLWGFFFPESHLFTKNGRGWFYLLENFTRLKNIFFLLIPNKTSISWFKSLHWNISKFLWKKKIAVCFKIDQNKDF